MISLNAMNTCKSRRKQAGMVALFFALAVGMGGCPKPKPKLDRPVKETDPGRFLNLVRERAGAVERMDARLEVELSAGESPFQGRFLGSFQMERQGSELALLLQAYTLLGAPALEVIVKGERLEVYAPLNDTMFFNFTELMGGRSWEDVPLSTFSRAVVPVDLIRRQIALVFGEGFLAAAHYDLKFEGDRYLISEFEGDRLSREFTYGAIGPSLLGVKLYEEGRLLGTMSCSHHLDSPAEAAFIPGQIELMQGDVRVTLVLSRVRLNQHARSGVIAFRSPRDEKLILLTPPAP
jgi:hypothetical protein